MTLVELRPTVWVSTRASIDDSVIFGRYVRIYGPAQVGAETIVGDFVTLGHPSPLEVARFRSSMRGSLASMDVLDDLVENPTTIGRNSIIRGPSVIYSGVSCGECLDCAHNVTVRENCAIGDRCYLKVNAELRREVVIGHNVTLAGTVGDRSTIGNGVTSFGYLMHRYDKVVRGRLEVGPTLKDHVFVGRGASVIGPVTLGEHSYVAAGAIVTKNVPACALVKGDAAVILEDRSPQVLYPMGKEDHV